MAMTATDWERSRLARREHFVAGRGECGRQEAMLDGAVVIGVRFLDPAPAWVAHGRPFQATLMAPNGAEITVNGDRYMGHTWLYSINGVSFQAELIGDTRGRIDDLSPWADEGPRSERVMTLGERLYTRMYGLG